MGAAFGQTDPLASGELEIRGSRLTLYSDATSGVTDAEQTLNVGERGLVRTCFAGPTVPCGSLMAGDPRIAGLRVEAELSGPELPQPLPLTTVPGGAFVLPSFQQEGDYTLENIRLVSEGDGQVLALAMPSLAVLHVRQIVLASATVRQLSLAELRARGIDVTEENMQAFDFAVGFAIQGETVEIEFPVQFIGHSGVRGLAPPKIDIDQLPPDVVEVVERWQPPRIMPFRLAPEPDPEDPDTLDIGIEAEVALTFPVYGAIVLPGSVSYLNQFFEAKLIVANGADAGSNARLQQVEGVLRLPGGNVIRLAETEPRVAPGQPLPVVTESFGTVLDPGEQGSAAWTLEGLRAGTHALFIDIEGELTRPGREPEPVRSRVQAAVEVVDARFHLTFSHPDVVREGEAYTLFVTVANQSTATQNLITVELKRNNLSGATPADAQDDLRREIETLAPGESQTLEFDLVSTVTGKVAATTFQADSAAGLGTIQLRAGVGELGIPLSPATLLMPRFTRELEQATNSDLIRSHVRLLGLGYSLAVAPAAMLPPGVASVRTSDVTRRALDLAEAGQRIWLQDGVLESVEVLLLDSLGNRQQLAGYDGLRRQTTKGQRAAEEIARVLRQQQEARALDAEGLFDHLLDTASYRPAFLAALAEPLGAGSQPALEIVGKSGTTGVLRGTADVEASAVRTLPWGEVYSVRVDPGSDQRAPLAMVGSLDPDHVLQVILRNDHAVPTTTRLVLALPDAATGLFRRVDFGVVTLEPGQAVAVDVSPSFQGPAQGFFALVDVATGAVRPEAAIQSSVPLPPFRLIGARQDFDLIYEIDFMGNIIRPNRYGQGITYLFNRPPAAEIEESPEAWTLATRFEGLHVNGSAFAWEFENPGEHVQIQDESERVAIVRYRSAISSLFSQGVFLSEHVQDVGNAVVDRLGEPLSGDWPEIQLETVPQHTGGAVTGLVKSGNGTLIAGAKVELIRNREWITKDGVIILADLAASMTTGADGRFFFDFVEQPFLEKSVLRNFFLRATVGEGDDAQAIEVGTVIRQQNRVAELNLAFLGRGMVEGRLVYADDQSPVANGDVSAVSSLFGDMRRTRVAADGSFELRNVPVGPVVVTGSDPAGRRVYATVEVPSAGSVTEVLLQVQRTPPPGVGRVEGRVSRFRLGQTWPVEGARVACYSNGRLIQTAQTGEDGRFVFASVPEGRVTLQASDWRVSRTSVLQDELLYAGGLIEAELRIPETSDKVVSGKVLRRDVTTGAVTPFAGALVYVEGPGSFAYSDAAGDYRIEGVPVHGVNEVDYQLMVVDEARNQRIAVTLPPVIDVGPTEIVAPTVVFDVGAATGMVRGVVIDPLGHPARQTDVVVYPFAEIKTDQAGAFTYELGVGNGGAKIVAHVGDGLEPGKIGYFGSAPVSVLYPGHSPFVTVSMVGSGRLQIKTRTATSTGVLTPIFYRPTIYSSSAKDITLKGQHIETTTDPNGDLELELPVGDFELVAYNPFHGIHSIAGRIDYAGEVEVHEIVFQDAGSVSGQVVGADGVTPVPGAEVTLRTAAFLPQVQIADQLGRFFYDLVPKGPVDLQVRGLTQGVERVGRTVTYITAPGQDIDVVVQMKEQGSVAGRIVEVAANGAKTPLPFAQYYVEERSYPFRRIPAERGVYFDADANGQYEVSHLFAGPVTIHARDPEQVERQASAQATIAFDWQRVAAPDVEFKGSDAIGTLEILVLDPATGAPVPDAQVKLIGQETSVSGSDGLAIFESLRMGTYAVYAFYAPSGRSGRVADLRLVAAGEVVRGVVTLDQRGEVTGKVFDDASLTTPIAGSVVEIRAQTAGGLVRGLATTSAGDAAQRGRFEFLGIPEGAFTLTASDPNSTRRGTAAAQVTATSLLVNVQVVLEPVRDVYVRLYEKLTAGNTPVDLEAGLFSVRLRQPAQAGAGQQAYDFTRLESEDGTDVFRYPGVMPERQVIANAQELTAEQRSAQVSVANLLVPQAALPGAGTVADPLRLLLAAKGTVAVLVVDTHGQPQPGINVNVSGRESATGSDGRTTFYGIGAGAIGASARHPVSGQSGVASGTLTYDDQTLSLTVTLSAAVSATGVVYFPTINDQGINDVSTLTPMPGAIVQIVRSGAGGNGQVMLTDAGGAYTFHGLQAGTYNVTAQDNDGLQLARMTVVLAGPDGNINALPPMVLDASPPRIVSISPPTGAEGVSRGTQVEIVFSEPLHAEVLPSGPISSFFALRTGTALVAGNWSYFLNQQGQQVVRFVPAGLLANFTSYSLSIKGGATGGVRDRLDRPLTTAASVGSSFRTSDSVGPAVIATVPPLHRPVPPTAPIRVDFSEKLVATAEALDADGFDDAAVLEAQRLDGAWIPLPLATYLTRLDFSLQIEVLEGFEVPDDSGRRRLTVSRLQDGLGNAMAPWTASFRLYDANAPTLDVPNPANAPDGNFYQGVTYAITPTLGSLEDVTPENPGGDIDRVEYYLTDPDDAATSVQVAGSVTAWPFAYNFVGVYVGNGVDPYPRTLWVRAFDTSTNSSSVRRFDFRILPNAPPVAGTATIEPALAGSQLYVGRQWKFTFSGISDFDGNRVTIAAKVRREDTQAVLHTIDFAVDKPAAGWPALAPVAYNRFIPRDLPEGTPVYVAIEARDAAGLLSTAESARYPVADDTGAPSVSSVLVDGTGRPNFVIGQSFTLRSTASDAETGVKTVTFSLDRDDIFPASPWIVDNPSAGTTFASPTIPVPAGAFTETTTVVATFRIEDWGGNVVERTATFTVRPADDPHAPQVRWQSPWDGAEWPAAYTSLRGAGDGAALLLRARVTDQTVNGSGQPVPGSIVQVEFRGPQWDGTAAALTEAWQLASAVAGTTGDGFGTWQLLWEMPNDLPAGTRLPFAVRAIDSGGTATVETIEVEAVPYRQVYEQVSTSILPDNAMLAPGGDPAGAVFLLNSTISLYPQTDGSVRSLPALYLYAGGHVSSGQLVVDASVLTAPEITTLASAITHYPLELAVARDLGIGGATRVDVDGRGLLGGRIGSGIVEMTLPGIRGAEPGASGSHGGLGGDHIEGARSGETYDSLRAPRLPGGGSRSTDLTLTGGNGGGVVRLLGGTAAVRLEGEISAEGLAKTNAGAGAGGAIHLVVDTLAGGGAIVADGATGSSARGSGGGGRVSLIYRELQGFDPVVQASAMGFTAGITPTSRLGGAGTVYVEQAADPLAPAGSGRLLLNNPIASSNSIRADLTPLPGVGRGRLEALDAVASTLTLDRGEVAGDVAGERIVLAAGGADLATLPILGAAKVGSGETQRVQVTVEADAGTWAGLEAALGAGTVEFRGLARFERIEARGKVRAFADPNLELGPEGATALDDRTHLQLSGGAVVVLANDVPTFPLNPTPNTATVTGPVTVIGGGTIAAPIGVATIRSWWQEETPTVLHYSTSSETLSQSFSFNRALPTGAPEGPITLTVEAEDRAGRVTRKSHTWQVLANTPPTVTLTTSNLSLNAGGTRTLNFLAEDAQALQSATLTLPHRFSLVSGTALRTLNGQSASFSYQVRADSNAAAGLHPFMLTVLDSAGASVELAFDLRILGAAPIGSFGVNHSGSAIVFGQPLTASVNVTDTNGDLERIDLTWTGAVSPAAVTHSATTPAEGYQIAQTFSFTIDPSAVGTTITLSASARDLEGNVRNLGQRSLQVIADTEPPSTYIPIVEGFLGESQEFAVYCWDNVGMLETRMTLFGETYLGVDGASVQMVVPGDEPFETTLSYRCEDVNGFVAEGDVQLAFRHRMLPTLLVTPGLEAEPGDVVLVEYLFNDYSGYQPTLRVDGPGVSIGPVDDFYAQFQVPYSAGAGDSYVVSAEGVILGPQGEEIPLSISATITVVDSGSGPGEDPGPPEVDILFQPPVATPVFIGGQTVEVLGAAADASGIASMVLTIDGETTSAPSPGLLTRTLTLPVVSAPETLVIEVSATAVDGETTTATREITIVPPPTGPEVVFVCGTDGATLPVGETLEIAVRAEDALGVAAIDLYVDGAAEPFATAAPPGGAQNDFTGTFTLQLPPTAANVALRAVARSSAGVASEALATLHAVEAIELSATGANDWNALSGQVAVLRSGQLTLTQPVTLGGLIVLSGASITHADATIAAPKQIDLTIDGPVYVACGGAIDATGRGLAANIGWPGHTGSAGSHVGKSGSTSATVTTYGSVERPTEPGAGGAAIGGTRGGGVVRVHAAEMVVDGRVAANGGATTLNLAAGGAGGSVWLTVVGALAGSGSVEARGADGNGSGASGGGGAIAIEASAIDLGTIDAYGGVSARPGGAGSVVTRQPEAPLADFVLDGVAVDGRTRLPEVALVNVYPTELEPGVASITREAGFANHLYLAGTWLEILDEARSIGTFRVLEAHADHLRLAWDVSQVEAPYAGFQARTVYRFASFRGKGGAMESATAIQVAGNVALEGTLHPPALAARSIQVLPGASLSQATTTTQTEVANAIDLSARVALVLAPGSALDVTGKGYGSAGATYPGATGMGNHIGLATTTGLDGYPGTGTVVNPLAARPAFGSIESPREAGHAGHVPGGGIITLKAGNLYQPATTPLLADGAPMTEANQIAGAGGSVWIDVQGTAILHGRIEADGGDATATLATRSGGGGAISLAYGELVGGLGEVHARGGAAATDAQRGGAGTLVTRLQTEELGDLRVDNGETSVAQLTVLPRIGRVQVTSFNQVYPPIDGQPEFELCGYLESRLELNIGLEHPVLEYSDLYLREFAVGRWLELVDGAGATRRVRIDRLLPGFFDPRSPNPRLARDCAVVRGEEGLESFAPEYYRGLHLFRDIEVRNAALYSEDVIQATGRYATEGPTSASEVVAGEVLVRSGSKIVPRTYALAALFKPLSIRVEGDLTVEEGATIDASATGLDGGYPGVAAAATAAGSTHIGVGGAATPAARGKAYGRLRTPAEPGAGKNASSGTVVVRGGGAIAIAARDIVLEGADSAIRANGASSPSASLGGAAGGSIQLQVRSVEGPGTIEAKGGRAQSATSTTSGSGGGGAVAIEYDSLDPGLRQRILVHGGDWGLPGGAGSLYLFDRASSNRGDLILDNESIAGRTELPSLGSGAVVEEGWGVLAIDRVFLPLFVGHWVEARHAGSLLGQWQIARIFDFTTSESPNPYSHLYLATGEEPPFFEAGDSWTGFYHFDSYTRGANVSVDTVDPLRYDTFVDGQPATWAPTEGEAAAATALGDEVPALDLSAVSIEAAQWSGLYRIVVPPSAVASGRVQAEARLLAGDRQLAQRWSASTGAVFLWLGRPGERLELELIERGTPALRRGQRVALPPLPALAGPAVPGIAAGEQLFDVLAFGDGLHLLIGDAGGEVELRRVVGSATAVAGRWPALHEEHRLALTPDGEVVVLGRGGLDGASDAVLRFRGGQVLTEPIAAGEPPAAGAGFAFVRVGSGAP